MCELERGPLKLQRGQFASGGGDAAHEDFDPSKLHADAVLGIVIASSLPAFASGLVSWFEKPVGRWRVDAVCQGADEVLARVTERVPSLIVATDELDAAGLMGCSAPRDLT